MVLSVQGLSVPLGDTPFGPLPHFQDRDLESLELAVQWAVEGQLPGARQAVAEQRPVGRFPVVIRPAEPGEDLSEAQEPWRRLTGRELGDDVYVVHSALGTPNVALPRKALLELLDEVNRLRQSTKKPDGPWLFREIPIWHDPAPGEEEALRQLERQAEELESIVSSPPSPEARAVEAAKRRFLLIELDALGILSDVGVKDKERWLETWNLPLTLGYLRAAARVHAYFVGPGRRRYFPDAQDEPVLGARISVDWFRRPAPVPVDWDPDEWLACCEQALLQSTVSGYEGTLLIREGGPWLEISWRRDDGHHPAVFRARLRS